jgi:hypothetical protein
VPRLELADREDLLLDENSANKRVNFAVKCSFISGLDKGEKNIKICMLDLKNQWIANR